MKAIGILHGCLRAVSVFGIVCVVCGCDRSESPEERRVLRPPVGSVPGPLPRVFSTGRDAFQVIVGNEGLPQDEKTLFGLAVDSTVERVGTGRHGVFSIVRPQYYDDRKYPYGIRGAQGQGNYYVFRRDGPEWRLVGVLRGSSYELRGSGDDFFIITGWHMSAGESPKTVYSWNGRTFEQVAPE